MRNWYVRRSSLSVTSRCNTLNYFSDVQRFFLIRIFFSFLFFFSFFSTPVSRCCNLLLLPRTFPLRLPLALVKLAGEQSGGDWEHRDGKSERRSVGGWLWVARFIGERWTKAKREAVSRDINKAKFKGAEASKQASKQASQPASQTGR